MKLEDSPIDRKLIVLEAYLVPFKWDIAEARKKHNEEISARTKTLEELVSDKNSIQFKALEALKNNRNQEYEQLMWEIKKQYDLDQVRSLQCGTYTAIQKELEKEEIQKRPTEPIEKQKEEAAEQTILKEMPRREYYQTLIQKYNGKMYEIREKIKEDGATGEEMDAWLAWFVQDLVSIKKGLRSSKTVAEETSFFKGQLPKWGRRPILSVYYAELKELGIWKDI